MRNRQEKAITGKIKVCIIGHFGGRNSIVDGQTVKTKTLYNCLSNRTSWKIKKVDTYYKKRNPLLLIFQTVTGLLFYKKIIVLLSGNGMRVYFPVLYFFARIRGTEVYHDIVGGNLDTYVAKYPKYKKYLNAFKYNFAETSTLKNKLEEQGIGNCLVIPNFKDIKIVKCPSGAITTKPIRFCTFSRVTEEKGVTDAVETVARMNKEKKMIGTIDIYGPVDKTYQGEFNRLLKEHSDCARYCGTVQFDKSVDVLSGYSILLFPTHWEGEGFPGTIIDAFAAGLPVIATDWRSNSEIVHNYKTGIIYPNKHERTLAEAIERIISNRQLYDKMRYNCIEEASEYAPEKHIGRIIELINRD